jgi:hypothetical protein
MPEEHDAPGGFDPLGLIAVLNKHGVEYIVIGGIAAGVQGAVWVTADLDLVYASSADNYERLQAALAELNATPVELPDGITVRLDARALRAGDVWTMSTSLGRLDLMREPAPGLDFEQLAGRAREIRGRHTYRVADLDDLVSMKRAAGRAKDIAHIELLEIAKEVSESRDGGSRM